MSPQYDDVSQLVNQAFNAHLQLEGFKKQLFRVIDELSMLCSSYHALHVISTSSDAESTHVGSVLSVLNDRFEDLLMQLEAFYKKDAVS